ncbi:MAG TPA: glycosyltransferase, partial [Pirellulaceae bacterium]|nr:glycosyltransferase [Pirellulaceae bacterium]
MSVSPQVVVVIPCFNESQRLQGAEFVEFAAARPHLRFLFVNDGSTDTTLHCLRAICSDLPAQLQVHDLPHNQGKAEAVRQGLLAALKHKPDLVGYWDADLATPLAAIDQAIDVLARRAELDIVAGVRLPLQGHTIQRKPLRRWLGRNFARCATQALRLSMVDTQCGAKMLRSGEALRWVLAQPFQSRWIFDVELFVRWRLFLQHAGEPPLAA